jgi:phospholipase/carboxylesterase
MPLAHRASPRATLLGVRGRSHEEGIARWFRRYTATTFDQADIRSEAEAFVAFIEGAIAGYGLDAARIAFLGFSNGANFAAAVMVLHPDTIRCAILLRAIPVLDELPKADLAGARVLMVTGSQDPFGKRAPVLANWFAECGADLDDRKIEAGHELVPGDAEIVHEWLHASSEGKS